MYIIRNGLIDKNIINLKLFIFLILNLQILKQSYLYIIIYGIYYKAF